MGPSMLRKGPAGLDRFLAGPPFFARAEKTICMGYTVLAGPTVAPALAPVPSQRRGGTHQQPRNEAGYA
jgi:hypothetical protein